MKVSINWLKDFVDLKTSIEELASLIPSRIPGGISELAENYFELDIKGYNRADLLSMRGVAYEVAAITDSKVLFTEPDKFVWANQNLPRVSVTVEDEKLAPVYTLAKIEGLKVGPSPEEWVKKLADCGMRSVNNIADITNLIMLEYGQPLHSFDAKAVKDEIIVVRKAKKGERITTLDGKTRDLEETDLLIADPQNNLGIAGVMGGKDSEITDNTTTILLEAAIFDPGNLRKTSTRLGLTSEASKRFYHGLTKKRLLQALDAAIRMYQELGGKLTALTIVGETEDQVKKVNLRLDKVNSLIGVEISADQVENYLKKLNFSVIASEAKQSEQTPEIASSATPPRSDGVGWEVTPPYYRLDIEIEEDLVEEVARIYGYENIPPQELEGELPTKALPAGRQVDQSLFDLIYQLKTSLVDKGFTEIQSYSYYSSQVLDNLKYEKGELIKIANPMSSETEYMRNHLWPNLVETVAKNVKQGFDHIAIFEVGKIYWPKEGEPPEESYSLSVALLDGSDNPMAQLNQIFQEAMKLLNLELSIGNSLGESAGRFHPVRYLYLNYQGQPIGKIGEVHSRIANSFGIEKRVAIAEIKIENLN